MLYWGRMNNTAMIKIFATWFGLGRAPKAPGTFGTVGAIPLVYLFSRFGEFQYMFATLAFTVAAIMVAHIYELTIADEHDSPEFVMDEVAGFLVTMTWVPFTWQYVLAGFILFRVLDALNRGRSRWSTPKYRVESERWPTTWSPEFWPTSPCKWSWPTVAFRSDCALLNRCD
jgi:phosphatidylglycerophosphatase A